MAITDPWSCDMNELKQAAFSPAPQVQAPPEVQQAINNFEQFRALCPDFQYTPENAGVLGSYAAEFYKNTGRIAAPEELRQAHALATYHQKYTPAAQLDPATMPLDQLKAMGAEVMPPQPELSLDEQARLSLNDGIAREHAKAQFSREHTPYVSGTK